MEKADFVQNKKKSSLLPDVQTPSLTSETKSSSTSNKMIPTKEDVVNKKQSKEYTKKGIALNEGIQFPNISISSKNNISEKTENVNGKQKKQYSLSEADSAMTTEVDSDIKYSLYKYTEKQLKNWKASKNIIVYEGKEQLTNFISEAKEGKLGNQKMYFGVVPESLAEMVMEKTGVDIRNRNVTLGAYEVQKIFKEHGNEYKEAQRGQRAVTVDDFENIIELNDPPKVVHCSTTKTNANKRAHGIDKEVLKKLPELIAEPVMIADSLSTASTSGVVVVTSEIDNEGKPIIVPIKPDGSGYYFAQLDSNFILSIYGRNGFENFIENNIKEKTFLYINSKKSQDLSDRMQLQLLQRLNSFDFDTIIRKSNNIVNSNKEAPLENRVSGDELLNAQDTLEIIKDVGGSVDNNGYVTLYHRTSKEKAKQIIDTKRMSAKEDGIFFSTSESGYNDGYGDSVLEFKVPVELNDPPKVVHCSTESARISSAPSKPIIDNALD